MDSITMFDLDQLITILEKPSNELSLRLYFTKKMEKVTMHIVLQ